MFEEVGRGLIGLPRLWKSVEKPKAGVWGAVVPLLEMGKVFVR